jgi:hypothetical protein
MNVPETISNNLLLKLLSLSVALLLWLFVTYGRDTTLVLQVTPEIRQLRPGLAVAGELPPPVVLTVCGPKFQLHRLASLRLRLPLDLADAREGKVAFPDMERLVHLPAGVRITRISPATLELRLEKAPVR